MITQDILITFLKTEILDNMLYLVREPQLGYLPLLLLKNSEKLNYYFHLSTIRALIKYIIKIMLNIEQIMSLWICYFT